MGGRGRSGWLPNRENIWGMWHWGTRNAGVAGFVGGVDWRRGLGVTGRLECPSPHMVTTDNYFHRPGFWNLSWKYVHSFRYRALRPAFTGPVFSCGSTGALG